MYMAVDGCPEEPFARSPVPGPAFAAKRCTQIKTRKPNAVFCKKKKNNQENAAVSQL
jgi:hypothetical protein